MIPAIRTSILASISFNQKECVCSMIGLAPALYDLIFTIVLLSLGIFATSLEREVLLEMVE